MAEGPPGAGARHACIRSNMYSLACGVLWAPRVPQSLLKTTQPFDEPPPASSKQRLCSCQLALGSTGKKPGRTWKAGCAKSSGLLSNNAQKPKNERNKMQLEFLNLDKQFAQTDHLSISKLTKSFQPTPTVRSNRSPEGREFQLEFPNIDLLILQANRPQQSILISAHRLECDQNSLPAAA